MEAGYHVEVICLKNEGDALREDIDGVRVYRIPITHRRTTVWRYFFQYGLSFLLFSILLTYLHLCRGYRCIHVATIPDFLVFTTIIPRLLGAKVLLDLHEPTPELWVTKYGNRHRVLLWLQIKAEQMAIQYADGAITVTDELRTRLMERGAQPEKIAVVRNVCDDSIFSCSTEARKSRGVDSFSLITHGLIEERCGHEDMVRTVSSLRDRIPNLRLEILGYGDFQTRLMRLVQELHCSDIIHFPGFVPHDELMGRLQAADVGVIAMRRSPYSELIDTNKMYEYVALRKPIIISKLRPIARAFDESCVKFFEPGDYEGLARCVLELFHDRQQGRRLAENAYKRYWEMRWEYSKNTYLRVVDNLVAQTERRTGYRGEKPVHARRDLRADCVLTTSIAKRPEMGEQQMDDVTKLTCRIAPDVKLGIDVEIHGFVNLYGCEIGDRTKIGTFVEIQKGARIGKNCKVSSHTFICEGVDIGNGVFIGHNVTFINDLYPRALASDGKLQTDKDWKCISTKVEDGASIGSTATILCGITIGENAIIGAGSVVTKNVPPDTIAAGNPAKILRRIDERKEPIL
jgi:acetyltransferase-like isoleucine patch superfamily enzyme